MTNLSINHCEFTMSCNSNAHFTFQHKISHNKFKTLMICQTHFQSVIFKFHLCARILKWPLPFSPKTSSTIKTKASYIKNSLFNPFIDATVYVGNLDEKVTEPILWELFLQAGPVCTLVINKHYNIL